MNQKNAKTFLYKYLICRIVNIVQNVSTFEHPSLPLNVQYLPIPPPPSSFNVSTNALNPPSNVPQQQYILPLQFQQFCSTFSMIPSHNINTDNYFNPSFTPHPQLQSQFVPPLTNTNLTANNNQNTMYNNIIQQTANINTNRKLNNNSNATLMNKSSNDEKHCIPTHDYKCTAYKLSPKQKPGILANIYVSKRCTKELSEYIVDEEWGEDCTKLYKYLDFYFRCLLFKNKVLLYNNENEKIVFHTGLKRRSDGKYLYLFAVRNETSKQRIQDWQFPPNGDVREYCLARDELIKKLKLDEKDVPLRTEFYESKSEIQFNKEYTVDLQTNKARLRDFFRKRIGNKCAGVKSNDSKSSDLNLKLFDRALDESVSKAKSTPIAIAQIFVDTKGREFRVELLIPMHIKLVNNSFTFVLALREVDCNGGCGKKYQAMSLLTLEMAYANARLMGYDGKSWLKNGSGSQKFSKIILINDEHKQDIEEDGINCKKVHMQSMNDCKSLEMESFSQQSKDRSFTTHPLTSDVSSLDSTSFDNQVTKIITDFNNKGKRTSAPADSRITKFINSDFFYLLKITDLPENIKLNIILFIFNTFLDSLVSLHIVEDDKSVIVRFSDYVSLINAQKFAKSFPWCSEIIIDSDMLKFSDGQRVWQYEKDCMWSMYDESDSLIIDQLNAGGRVSTYISGQLHSIEKLNNRQGLQINEETGDRCMIRCITVRVWEREKSEPKNLYLVHKLYDCKTNDYKIIRETSPPPLAKNNVSGSHVHFKTKGQRISNDKKGSRYTSLPLSTKKDFSAVERSSLPVIINDTVTYHKPPDWTSKESKTSIYLNESKNDSISDECLPTDMFSWKYMKKGNDDWNEFQHKFQSSSFYNYKLYYFDDDEKDDCKNIGKFDELQTVFYCCKSWSVSCSIFKHGFSAVKKLDTFEFYDDIKQAVMSTMSVGDECCDEYGNIRIFECSIKMKENDSGCYVVRKEKMDDIFEMRIYCAEVNKNEYLLRDANG